MNKSKAWLAALITLGSMNVEAIDINDAIKQTLKNHPVIKERLSNFNSVREDVNYADGAYLPSLDVSFGIGQEKAKAAGFDRDTTDFSVNKRSVSMSYNIFNGFYDSHTSRQQLARLQSAAYSYLDKANETILNLIEQYINVARHKELIIVEQDNIRMDEKIYDNMLGKQRQGLQRLSDLKEARSKLALAYTNHLSEENNVQDTLVSLHKYLGRYISLNDVETPTFEEQLPNSLEEITKIALKSNPSIKVALSEREAALQEYKATRSAYFPKLDLEVSDSASTNISGIEGESTNFSTMLVVSYNLYNGNTDRAISQKKVSEMHMKDQDFHQIKRDVIEKIQLSWNAFRITSKQAVFIRWYVQSSKDKLNSYYKEFNVGRRSLIDLLGASDDYNNARRKMINTKYDLMFARYRLLEAMGELTNTLDIDIKANVGLSLDENELAKKDSDVLIEDMDNDKIHDNEDICMNSIVEGNTTSEMSHYGCKNVMKSNNSGFKALESFLNESIKTFVKESDSVTEIEGWE
jgi:outer membrane protein, adhesin transport system